MPQCHTEDKTAKFVNKQQKNIQLCSAREIQLPAGLDTAAVIGDLHFWSADNWDDEGN